MTKRRNKFYLFLIFFLLSNFNINANEINKFLSLKNNEVNVRAGPSKEYPIKFIYKKKFLTVEILDSWANWKKVKDFNGNNGWIHVSLLSGKKTAINKIKDSIIFTSDTIYSKPLVRVDRGRLLLVKKCGVNWCKVISGNYIGWIKKKNLWGKVN